MPTAIIQQKDAQKILAYLRKNDFIDTTRYLQKREDVLAVPIITTTVFKKNHKVKIVAEELPYKKKHVDFKEEVEKILTSGEAKRVKTAFDMIGTIAVLEIDKELDSKAKQIAEILLRVHPKIETVVRKRGAHAGELRLQQYEFLAGERTFSTIHKENGCFLHVTLGEVYYSPRSATERLRIASQIKKGEIVMVFFSGCGPFVCTVAKNTLAKEVWGIELNQKGHEFAVENIALNKLKNAHAICEDVRDIQKLVAQKKIPAAVDRICMPLPKNASEFLPYALAISKKGTIIHLYDFESIDDFPQKTVEKIEQECKRAGKKFKVVGSALCGQYSPKIHRVCVDFKVL